ncbi:MAG: glycosyltransferase [Magnetovibrio sp.]|nr:glycosyltransferase [Magnetovibrio sp.]
MIDVIIILTILIPVGALILDAKAHPIHKVVLSPFWYFSFLFIIAFALRAYLIDRQMIDLQTIPPDLGYNFDQTILSLALIFALSLWACVYVGWKQTRRISQPTASAHLTASVPGLRLMIGLLVICVSGIGAIFAIGSTSLADFDGIKYQSSRMGSGALWLLPEFILYATLGYIAWLISRPKFEAKILLYGLLIVLVALTFWASNMLFTRRLMSAAIFAVFIYAVVRNAKLWPLALAGILSTVLASSILDFLRQTFYIVYNKFSSHEQVSNSPVWDNISSTFQIIFGTKFLSYVSSTFEGVDHIYRMFERVSWQQLLFGIDHGMSWFFNSGAALIPRAIWASKPVNYGGLGQTLWLYPEVFRDGFATAAIPMSFAIDFSFGFGILFALVLAFVFGRLLGVSERTFWDRASHPAQIALALFIFIYMFNWVRGGTIIIQSIILFSIPCILLFGMRHSLHAAFGLAGEAVGLVGGKWWGTSHVFFYPHAYLRDRQMDTISNWPQDNISNADIVSGRAGAQVTRDQAFSTNKKSWKSTLPLINLKRRPKQTPENATVYVWGGLITKGPFITDIDNPYAFCAYNTLAVKLYRPIIRVFLESPRCLQIRCLSQACLDGVRREYGEVAAGKSIVAYPEMPPAVDSPISQSQGPCKFLFISTQFEIKGGAALLNAFEELSKTVPNVELHLVTHLPPAFQDRVDAHPNIYVHEANLTRDEISQKFLSTHHVLVHPTYFDSFGMVVLEALAHGLPVITTDIYALPELVQDGKNGILCTPPLSIWSGTKPSSLFSDTNKVRIAARLADTSAFEQDLSNAMVTLAQSPELRQRYGSASLERSRTLFSKLK